MSSEIFQTRLAPDQASAVHDYMEARNISKAEATRRLIKRGLKAQDEDRVDTQTDDKAREDQLHVLARLGERLIAGGLILTAISIIFPFFMIDTFDLTAGSMGVSLLVGITFGTIVLGAGFVLAGSVLVVKLFIRHGIQAGVFGRTLAERLPIEVNTR